MNRRELGAVALASTLLCGALDATGLWRGAERALVDGALRGEVSRDAIEAVARGMVRAGVGALGPTETGARAVFALAALASAVGLAWATGRALRGASGAWTLLVYATAPLVLSTARHATAAALSQAVFTSLFALSIALQAREPQRVQIGAPWLSRLAMLSFAWFTTRGGASTDVSTALESLGHALFPWTGLAAFAVFALAAPSSADDRERAVRAESLATLVVLLALHAWRGEAAAPLFAAPVAVAVALLLDRGALDRAGVWLVLLVMAVQARDLSLYPRPFVWPSGAPSPTVEGARASFSAFAEGALSPGGYALAAFVACVPAVVMGLCGARRARLAVIAGAVCAALLLSRGAERAWGRSLSSSAAWSALRAQSSAHDPVALLASSDDPPPALYASASLPRWGDGASATSWLREGDTRWLVLESAQLGALNSAHRAATGRNVAITGGYAAGWMLAATWAPGRRSVNPLDAVVSSEAIRAPEGSRGEAYPIAREAVFEDALVLEGIDQSVPASPPRGSAVRLGHHLRVLRAVPTAQVFVHVDGPCARINADHSPAAGRYPTPLWRAGDRVRDAYEFTIPWYCPRGRYAVWAGFFQGERRLRVTRGPHDADNRVLVTTLEVR